MVQLKGFEDTIQNTGNSMFQFLMVQLKDEKINVLILTCFMFQFLMVQLKACLNVNVSVDLYCFNS